MAEDRLYKPALFEGLLIPWQDLMREFRCSRTELQEFIDKRLVMSPIKLEHRGSPLGVIEQAWAREGEGLYIKGRLFSEKQCTGNRELIDQVLRGDIKGLSICTDFLHRDTPSQQIHSIEGSLVKDPGFPGSRVIRLEANAQGLNATHFKVIPFKVQSIDTVCIHPY